MVFISVRRQRKIRNFEIAVIQKNDPTRFRSRIVEPEDRKLAHVRARRKAALRRDSQE